MVSIPLTAAVLPLGARVELQWIALDAAGGANRRKSAPGMVVFYPLEPLKRGATYDVQWSFTRDIAIRRMSPTPLRSPAPRSSRAR